MFKANAPDKTMIFFIEHEYSRTPVSGNNDLVFCCERRTDIDIWIGGQQACRKICSYNKCPVLYFMQQPCVCSDPEMIIAVFKYVLTIVRCEIFIRQKMDAVCLRCKSYFIKPG